MSYLLTYILVLFSQEELNVDQIVFLTDTGLLALARHCPNLNKYVRWKGSRLGGSLVTSNGESLPGATVCPVTTGVKVWE